jgi:hypothetical protein
VEIKPSSATPNFFYNWGRVTHGVHKGSILGPLLFITYINDLPPTIKASEHTIFSDDTSVTISKKGLIISGHWQILFSLI